MICEKITGFLFLFVLFCFWSKLIIRMKNHGDEGGKKVKGEKAIIFSILTVQHV